MADLTEEQIKKVVNQYLTETFKMLDERWLVDDDEYFPPRDYTQGYLETLEIVEGDRVASLNAGDYSGIEDIADGLLKKNGIFSLDKNSYHFKKLCRELQKAEIKMIRVEKRQMQGDFSDNLNNLLGRPPVEDKPESIEKPSITLKQLIDDYFSEMLRSVQWAESTQKEYTTSYNLLKNFFGDDKQIHTIDRQAMLTFKKVLLKLPPYFLTSKKYEDMTLQGVLETDFDKTLSVSAVRRYLINTGQLFDYAVDHGYMATNLAKGLLPPKSKRPQDERDIFDIEDLEKIFYSKQYREDSFKHHYQFWLSPLGAYTGLRIEELCQLHVEDLKQTEEGIWYLDINDDGEKKLKNKASNRVVPLHPVLVETLNFPGYVQELKDRGEVRVFPELKAIRNKYSHYASRWFNEKYKKQINLDTTVGQKKVYHSFRHLVQDWLKQKLLPEVLVAELAGHVVKGQTFGRYGKHLRVKVLYEKAILELDYGIDLSHLKKSKFVTR